MTETVSIPDNAYERSLSLSEEQWQDLSLIAGRTIKKLCDQDETGMSLLVFPDSLDVYGDKIGENTVITIQDRTLSSGNLMGFVGCRDTKLRIHSRFDQGENDYLMHYLLEKVFSVHLFDLKYSTNPESVFDFVLFLFPFFLKRALSQGLYKEYVTIRHNDNRVRGVVEIARHIRSNIPFIGNIAYKTREHTADNDLMELIRHTIEFIRLKEFGAGILSRDEETKADISLIVDATPSYEKNARASIISRNLRAKIHPYFSEYEPLRKLCIQILRQEEIKYGIDDDTVYGVLFDGAWLWEEYLNTLLEKIGFKHPENRKQDSKGFKSLFVSGRGKRYPDFFNDSMILDAKYKRYNGKTLSDVSTEDIAQIVSYMHVKPCQKGGLLVPGFGQVYLEKDTLRGLGGDVFILTLPIPQETVSYGDFCSEISLFEKSVLEQIKNLIKQ